DVLLLIEVADTTIRYDRDVKIPLYARAGIPEVWLIDLQQERVEIYLQPSSEGYRQILRPGKSERIALSLLPDVSLLITDLWSHETGKTSERHTRSMLCHTQPSVYGRC